MKEEVKKIVIESIKNNDSFATRLSKLLSDSMINSLVIGVVTDVKIIDMDGLTEFLNNYILPNKDIYDISISRIDSVDSFVVLKYHYNTSDNKVGCNTIYVDVSRIKDFVEVTVL